MKRTEYFQIEKIENGFLISRHGESFTIAPPGLQGDSINFSNQPKAFCKDQDEIDAYIAKSIKGNIYICTANKLEKFINPARLSVSVIEGYDIPGHGAVDNKQANAECAIELLRVLHRFGKTYSQFSEEGLSALAGVFPVKKETTPKSPEAQKVISNTPADKNEPINEDIIPHD